MIQYSLGKITKICLGHGSCTINAFTTATTTTKNDEPHNRPQLHNSIAYVPEHTHTENMIKLHLTLWKNKLVDYLYFILLASNNSNEKNIIGSRPHFSAKINLPTDCLLHPAAAAANLWCRRKQAVNWWDVHTKRYIVSVIAAALSNKSQQKKRTQQIWVKDKVICAAQCTVWGSSRPRRVRHPCPSNVFPK